MFTDQNIQETPLKGSLMDGNTFEDFTFERK